ncbi:MAG: cytochrome o ubiquinol oxidase subunit IV [Sphingomonas fennica]
MSHTPAATVDDHRQGDRPDRGPHDHADTAAHGSRRGYLIGFVLSVVLTAIPFWLVMARPFGANATVLLVAAFAAVQIIVHMIYFLHMTTKSEGGWTMMALIFTAVLVVITLAGSLWVMVHMNSNMMPMPPADMATMDMG